MRANPSCLSAASMAAFALIVGGVVVAAPDAPAPDLFDGSSLPADPQGPMAQVVRRAGESSPGDESGSGGAGGVGGQQGGVPAGAGMSGQGAGSAGTTAPGRQGVGSTAGVDPRAGEGAIGSGTAEEAEATAGEPGSGSSPGPEGPPLPAAPRPPRIGDTGAMVRGGAAAEPAPGGAEGPIGTRQVATEEGSSENPGANDPLQRSANAGGSRGGTGGNESGAPVPPDL